MKNKHPLRAKAMPLPETPAAAAPSAQPESVMDQIGALYRERLRAHYNNDAAALEKINLQIDILRQQL